MNPLALEVRRLIYTGALEECTIPLKGELVRATGTTDGEIDAALTELSDAHMIVLQRDAGEVLMANPFSAVPTPFLVTAGAMSWYANCVWDAMGIAAMTGREATLSTSCACCGTAMRLAVPSDCNDTDPRRVHFAIPAARWWNDIVYN